MKYRCSKLERSFGVIQELHSSWILIIAYVEGEKTNPPHLGKEITITVLETVSPLWRELVAKWLESGHLLGECVNWSVFGGS